MKKTIRNSIHDNERSHDCMVYDINGVVIKITYEAYNAVERCNTEIFDNVRWNHFCSMRDLGVEPNSSAYIWSAERRKMRANELFAESSYFCNEILKK